MFTTIPRGNYTVELNPKENTSEKLKYQEIIYKDNNVSLKFGETAEPKMKSQDTKIKKTFATRT